MKFNINDKVRVVADEEKLAAEGLEDLELIGQEGVIHSIEIHGEGIDIAVEIGKDIWSFDEEDLELIEEVKAEFIQDGEKQEKQYGHPRFYEILQDMAELHSRKNHDYAGTSDPLKNLRACERLELEPFMGVMVRLQDKWSRLEEFVKSGKLMVKGEGVKDTLLDNAVYSILGIVLYEEQEKNENK